MQIPVPPSNSRSQWALQRKMTAEKMEAELEEWRREVDHYNRTVSKEWNSRVPRNL